jgi:DnaJ-like protein
MDHPLLDLINARIAAAEADGAFEDIAGAGKPLPRSDDPANEIFNRIMRESGAVPEVVRLKCELEQLRADLHGEADRSKRRAMMAGIATLETRLGLALDVHRARG